MEQSDGITLEYKPANSLRGAHWLGNVLGREMKFVRVIAGLAVPQLDRQSGAIVVLGELDRASSPQDLTGLGAAVGNLPEIKNALMQFCIGLKPDHIVVENEQSRKIVWKVTDSLIHIKPPALSYVAPEHSITEIGRQNVQAMIDENRLHIEHL